MRIFIPCGEFDTHVYGFMDYTGYFKKEKGNYMYMSIYTAFIIRHTDIHVVYFDQHIY